MSFFEHKLTPLPQIKQASLSCYDHHLNQGGVLVSPFTPITLDLFNTKQSQPQFHFVNSFPKSKPEDQKCEESIMNRKNGSIPNLELRLNLSPPIPSSPLMLNLREDPQSRSPSVSPTSSCVSSGEISSPEPTSMVLVGCPRCLMYVMLSEEDPKCPKCKSTVLLGLLNNNNNNNHDNDKDKDNNNNCGNISK